MKKMYFKSVQTKAAAVFFILVSLFSLTACKKDRNNTVPGDGAYVKATIDGKPINFTTNVFAHKQDDNNVYVTGYTSNDAKNTEIFTLSLYNSPAPIKVQEYTLDGGPSPMLVIYSVMKNGGQTNHTASTGSYSPSDVFTIKITSIDKQSVKGTFAGTVVIQSGTTTTSILPVTDGSFSAPIK